MVTTKKPEDNLIQRVSHQTFILASRHKLENHSLLLFMLMPHKKCRTKRTFPNLLQNFVLLHLTFSLTSHTLPSQCLYLARPHKKKKTHKKGLTKTHSSTTYTQIEAKIPPNVNTSLTNHQQYRTTRRTITVISNSSYLNMFEIS